MFKRQIALTLVICMVLSCMPVTAFAEETEEQQIEVVVETTEPAAEETIPVIEATEPVAEETEPVIEETEPVVEETEPVIEVRCGRNCSC